MTSRRSKQILLLVFVATMFTASSSWAAIRREPSSSNGGAGMGPQISVAGGIAQGTRDLAVVQNPIALIYGGGVDVEVHGFSQDPGDAGFGGSLLLGGMGWGAALGAEHFTTMPSYSRANYGAALDIPKLKLALGADGHTNLDNDGHTDVDLALGLNPFGRFRLNFAFHNLGDSSHDYGAGLALRLTHYVTFVTDTTANDDFTRIALAPGLSLGNSILAVAGSYGFNVNSKNGGFYSYAFNDKFSGGVTLRLGGTRLAFYYKQPVYGQYFGSWTFPL